MRRICLVESENEGEFGPFWQRKFKHFFNVTADTDNDGVVTVKDYEKFADRFDSLPDVTQEQKESFRQQLVMREWEEVVAPLAANGPIDLNNFIKAYAGMGKPNLEALVRDYADTLFKTFDLNNDGSITEDEFAKLYVVFNVDLSHVGPAFNVIDGNGDGKITKEEFEAAVMDFCSGEDENSPYSILFGPLPE